MTAGEQLVTVLVIMAGTMLTRFGPFVLFRPGRRVPNFVRYLGRVLPPAAIGLLVVYCLADIGTGNGVQDAWKIAAVALVAVVQWFGKNALLSIVVGTVFFMLGIQGVLF